MKQTNVYWNTPYYTFYRTTQVNEKTHTNTFLKLRNEVVIHEIGNIFFIVQCVYNLRHTYLKYYTSLPHHNIWVQTALIVGKTEHWLNFIKRKRINWTQI